MSSRVVDVLRGDAQANIAMLLESGVCSVSGTASLVCTPAPVDYSRQPSHPAAYAQQQQQQHMPQQSAYGGGVGATYGGFDPRFASPYGATRGMPAQLIPGGSGAEDWYFVEMHASSLHESSQQRP